METQSSSTSELETFELLQSMNAVKGSLETSAEQVQGIVNTPRMLAAQIAKLKLEDEAQLLVFQSLESVLKQVQTAESSMSDDELANLLEELGKIAETWVTDRDKLVNDLARARKESEEMKNLALTACYEASSVVDRAQSQAKSRLEAKKRVKAENKVLQEQNVALMNACTKLTEEHATDLTHLSEGLNMAKEETLRIRKRMEHKLEAMSCILMKTVQVDIPFQQWRAFVHYARSEKLAQQSQELVGERAQNGSKTHQVHVSNLFDSAFFCPFVYTGGPFKQQHNTICLHTTAHVVLSCNTSALACRNNSSCCHSGQEESQGQEETKEELLNIWATETKALKQQHEEQVALLRAQHQTEVRAFSRTKHKALDHNLLQSCMRMALTGMGCAVRSNAGGACARNQQVQGRN